MISAEAKLDLTFKCVFLIIGYIASFSLKKVNSLYEQFIGVAAIILTYGIFMMKYCKFIRFVVLFIWQISCMTPKYA